MSTSALIQDRMRQLRQEEVVDKMLRSATRECPILVNHFLLNVRAYNRHLSQKLYDAPFYSMPTIYSENLEKMNKIQNFLLGSQKIPDLSNNPRNKLRATCENLQLLCEDMEQQMKTDHSVNNPSVNNHSIKHQTNQ